MELPYSDETLRENVTYLLEEASIEGDGICKGLRKISGVTGCVVTPLTMGTTPLLLCLAMGAVGLPSYISETRNLYQFHILLVPMEDTEAFDIIQDRGMRNEQLGMRNERKLYENCRVKGFELRILRDVAIKLKLDIYGERPIRAYPYTDTFEREQGERFSGECVTYSINGKTYTNIYGITLVSKKQGETKTEIWIKRVLQHGTDIPAVIDELILTARLLRDRYEYRYFGTFRLTLKRLVQVSDETEVNASGAVMSPLRYYVAGSVSADVFSSAEEAMP
jgi:hypothetical protein